MHNNRQCYIVETLFKKLYYVTNERLKHSCAYIIIVIIIIIIIIIIYLFKVH